MKSEITKGKMNMQRLSPYVVFIVTANSLPVNLSLGLAEVFAQSPIKWNNQQVRSVNKNCTNAMVSEAKKSGKSKINAKVADSYCSCVFNDAARRFEFLDFVKNERKYTNQLVKEGTINKCLDSAQKKTGNI